MATAWRFDCCIINTRPIVFTLALRLTLRSCNRSQSDTTLFATCKSSLLIGWRAAGRPLSRSIGFPALQWQSFAFYNCTARLYALNSRNMSITNLQFTAKSLV